MKISQKDPILTKRILCRLTAVH